MTWFAGTADCGSPDDAVAVTLPSSVCMTAATPPPVAVTAGANATRSWKVECNAGGSGGALLLFFNSSVCGYDGVKGVTVHSFNNAVCYALPALGGGSVSADCAPFADGGPPQATFRAAGAPPTGASAAAVAVAVAAAWMSGRVAEHG